MTTVRTNFFADIEPAATEHQWRPIAGRRPSANGMGEVPCACRCGATALRMDGAEGQRYVAVQAPDGGAMVQADAFDTHLPNGMLLWFGYDFERVQLPATPLLPDGEPPRWKGTTAPGFTWEFVILDGKVTVDAADLEAAPDAGQDAEDADWAPGNYNITVNAHGVEPAAVFTVENWCQAQALCALLENRLLDSHEERHSVCLDDEGRGTAEACDYCHL